MNDVIDRCIAELKSSDLPIKEAIKEMQGQHPELDAEDWRFIGQALFEEADDLERYVPKDAGMAPDLLQTVKDAMERKLSSLTEAQKATTDPTDLAQSILEKLETEHEIVIWLRHFYRFCAIERMAATISDVLGNPPGENSKQNASSE